jgi:ubiquinol-cytochrome c reductase cytochrome b subunit
MFAFMFTLFAASSTDVLANFFHVSLNATLWFFRIATFAIPIVAAFVTYQICKEMQGVHGIGKRKRAVIVTRSAEGAYATVPTAPRPDDVREELDPEPVPEYIDIAPLGNGGNVMPESSPTGVRQVTR